MTDNSSKKAKEPRSVTPTQNSTCSKRTKRTVAEPPPSIAANENDAPESSGSECREEPKTAPTLQMLPFEEYVDDDDVELFPNDLLNPKASAGDAICHCLHSHGWRLSLSRDFYCKATETSVEEFHCIFENYPLVTISSIMQFYGHPAHVEKGFIAGIEAVRKANSKCRKITAKECFIAKFEFEKQVLYCEILPLTKNITICTMDER